MDRQRKRTQETAKKTPSRIGERQGTIENNWVKWLFLTGNRFIIAGGLLIGIFSVVSGVMLVDSGPLRQPSPLFYVFGGLIGGNLTLITVVISINQLVLSRELGAPGKIQQQMQDMNEYRDEVAEATNRQVLPYLPPDFLSLLLETTRQRAQAIPETVEQTDEQIQTEVAALVTVITDHVDHVSRLLDQGDIRPFRALSEALNANNAAYIHDAERIRTTHGSVLPTAANERLEELTGALRKLEVAREYFKTLFLQEELALLSRVLLYVGIPAEVGSVSILVLFATTPAGGLPTRGIPFLAPIVITIGFVPLAVLFAFILRIATVTQHTAPILPFGMPKQEP